MVAKHLKSSNIHRITLPDSMTIFKQIHTKNIALTYESYKIYKHVKNHGPNIILNKI